MSTDILFHSRDSSVVIPPDFPSVSYAQVRQALIDGKEIALLDVREEAPFAQEHPLWAANFPLSRLELEAWDRIPRRDTPIVIYGHDDSGDLAPKAAHVLRTLGYSTIGLLEHGLEGWRAAGGELFSDVNVPSKSFGELVEAQRHTPSLSAQEVQALIHSQADVVIVDARRYDEYHTMSIPTATSVPGAELVLRVQELAPDPKTQLIVNCAGRTRSIIGTQSLINAGIPNPVAALRNGTIGWVLAGQTLDHGATLRHSLKPGPSQEHAKAQARHVADRAGVKRIKWEALDRLREQGRTLYCFDVRTPEEYEAGHLPGFAPAPGGQLVQETDHHAPVRGARIVLSDDDGVRACMTASWLAQMGWDVFVLEPVPGAEPYVKDRWQDTIPKPEGIQTVSVDTLLQWLGTHDDRTQILDFSPSANYVKAHIPGAWFALRSQLKQALDKIPVAQRYVFTCRSGVMASFAAEQAIALTDAPVYVLQGGTHAWQAAQQALESGESRLACPRIDRYRRPYEGTDAPEAAMQAYLDWEFGLVEQLRRDGTHKFKVL